MESGKSTEAFGLRDDENRSHNVMDVLRVEDNDEGAFVAILDGTGCPTRHSCPYEGIFQVSGLLWYRDLLYRRCKTGKMKFRMPSSSVEMIVIEGKEFLRIGRSSEAIRLGIRQILSLAEILFVSPPRHSKAPARSEAPFNSTSRLTFVHFTTHKLGQSQRRDCMLIRQIYWMVAVDIPLGSSASYL